MSNIKLITADLGVELIERIDSASSICILTAFIMNSGVSYIKEPLKRAAQRGADIKICTGDYFYITQPDALENLLKIDEKIEVRLWKTNNSSFHPKAYIFQNDLEDYFFVGSSNLSRSALQRGVEWNVSIHNEKEIIEESLQQFLQLFYDEHTIPINKETLKAYKYNYENYHVHHPNMSKAWSVAEEQDLMLPTQGDTLYPCVGNSAQTAEAAEDYKVIIPRQAQKEALIQLERTMEEAYDKALVVMATGERVIIVTGCINVLVSRVSGTLTKYNSCIA